MVQHRIARVDAIPFLIPFSPQFENWRIANRGPAQPGSGYVLVRVTSDSGAIGYGEAGRFCEGETPWTIIKAIEEIFAPQAQGLDALNVAHAYATIDRLLAQNTYAKSALEMALYDLAGKLLDVPVTTLLGGQIRHRIEATARIGVGESIEAVAVAAAAAAESGFNCVKVKIGEDPQRDLATIKRVREAVGDAVQIRVDANEGYRRADLGALLAMEEYGLLVIEQPLPRDDWAGLSQFTRSLSTPVMIDESVAGPSSVVLASRLEAADAIQVKVGRVGGIRCASDTLRAAHFARLGAGIGSMMEAGLGAAAILHVAASAPSVNFPLETTGATTFAASDILSEPLAPVGGDMLVPDGPGLGVEVDMSVIERYRLT